jgi:hypothetical protein
MVPEVLVQPIHTARLSTQEDVLGLKTLYTQLPTLATRESFGVRDRDRMAEGWKCG